MRWLAQRVECDEAAGDFDGPIRLSLAEEMVHRTLEGRASNDCDALALGEEPVLKLDLSDVEVVQQVAMVKARCLEVCLWGAGCDEADETVDIGLHPVAPEADTIRSARDHLLAVDLEQLAQLHERLAKALAGLFGEALAPEDRRQPVARGQDVHVQREIGEQALKLGAVIGTVAPSGPLTESGPNSETDLRHAEHT